jgi:hypothetical protein
MIKKLTLDKYDIQEILGMHYDIEVSDEEAEKVLDEIWDDVYKIVDDTMWQETQTQIRHWIRKNMKEKSEIL